jgi:hypothetical protein
MVTLTMSKFLWLGWRAGGSNLEPRSDVEPDESPARRSRALIPIYPTVGAKGRGGSGTSSVAPSATKGNMSAREGGPAQKSVVPMRNIEGQPVAHGNAGVSVHTHGTLTVQGNFSADTIRPA